MADNVLRRERIAIWDCSKPSINGRYYRAQTWKSAISDPFIQEFLNSGGLPIIFEADTSEFTNKLLCGKFVGYIRQIEICDDKLFGEVVIVDIPYGRIANDIFEKDYVHITPCGYGNIDKLGNITDLELHCFSLTVYPYEEGYN